MQQDTLQSPLEDSIMKFNILLVSVIFVSILHLAITVKKQADDFDDFAEFDEEGMY